MAGAKVQNRIIQVIRSGLVWLEHIQAHTRQDHESQFRGVWANNTKVNEAHFLFNDHLSSYFFSPLADLSPLLASPRSHYLSINCSVGCSYRAYLQYPGDEGRRKFPLDHPDMDKPTSPAKS